MAAVLVIYVVVAIVAAIVAGNKGRSGVGWFFLCLVATPLAILVLLALPSLKPSEPQPVRVIGEDDAGQRRPCPYCAELILPAATVCRFCSRELPQRWAEKETAAEATRTCPQCAETVKAETKICRFCLYEFPPESPRTEAPIIDGEAARILPSPGRE